MRHKYSYKRKIAALERDRDTLLKIIGALQEGPDDKIIQFFELFRASPPLMAIEDHLIREYPGLNGLDVSVLQELLDRTGDTSSSQGGSSDKATLDIEALLN